jgi:hypothetical protein
MSKCLKLWLRETNRSIYSGPVATLDIYDQWQRLPLYTIVVRSRDNEISIELWSGLNRLVIHSRPSVT